jgi:hypothetical protein
MGTLSSMRSMRLTAPALRIAPATPPHVTGSLPTRAQHCVNSEIVFTSARSNSLVVRPDSRACVLEIPLLPQLSIV